MPPPSTARTSCRPARSCSCDDHGQIENEIIALEEHFIMPREEHNLPPGAHRGNDREKLLGFDVVAELLNLGDTRLAAMDAAGIDAAGAFAQSAWLSGARRRTGSPGGERGQRHAVRGGQGASRSLPRARRPADCGSRGRRQRARSRGHKARIQGRDDQRSHARQLSRRQEVLGAFSSVRRRSGCPSTSTRASPIPPS